MSQAFTFAFIDFADRHKGKVMQLALRGIPAPFHGELQPYFVDPEQGPPVAGVYQVIAEAQLGPGAPVRKMAFVFAAEDVLWFSTGLLEADAPRLATSWNA